MAEGNGTDRISVSHATLKAELTGLELRLVDRLTAALEKKADQSAIDALEQRVAGLELSRAERGHLIEDVTTMNTRLLRLEKFRYGIPSAATLAAGTTLVLAFTNHL